MYLLDLLYFLLLFFLSPFYFRRLFDKSYRVFLKGRFIPTLSGSSKRRIWIHAVSVGEVKGLKSFVEELKERFDEEIVLSVTTRSGFDIGKELFPDLEVINSPIDLSFVIGKFINRINPKILILNELEIWPNWMKKMEREKIPVVLINGRISDRAYSRYRKFSFILKPFFKILSKVMIQGEWYRERFAKLGVPSGKIISCGNIKADEAIKASENLPEESSIRRMTGLKNRKDLFLFASTHPSDEKLFLSVLKEISEKFFVVIAPRHIERSVFLKNYLSGAGLKADLFSNSSNENDDSGILIFDKMGFLIHLIKISEIVYMGGGLDPSIGGHNLYEPAIMGKPVIGGPFFNNFPDIGRELAQKEVYKVISESGQLIKEIENISESDRNRIEYEARKAVESRTGAVNRILSEVREYFN